MIMGPQQETKYTTSFIPKKPVSIPKISVTKRGPNIISAIGAFIFLGSIIASAGTYYWKYDIEKKIESQIQTLQSARREFDERTIAEATRLNDRLNAVKTLLDNHKAPSNIFSLLEDLTLTTIRFNNLDYRTEQDGSIKISGSGSGRGFESVVLQSDEFGMSGHFRDAIFSNVQTNEQTGVTFSFAASLNGDIVLYKKLIGNITLNQ
jgi:hypothetical protein